MKAISAAQFRAWWLTQSHKSSGLLRPSKIHSKARSKHNTLPPIMSLMALPPQLTDSSFSLKLWKATLRQCSVKVFWIARFRSRRMPGKNRRRRRRWRYPPLSLSNWPKSHRPSCPPNRTSPRTTTTRTFRSMNRTKTWRRGGRVRCGRCSRSTNRPWQTWAATAATTAAASSRTSIWWCLR